MRNCAALGVRLQRVKVLVEVGIGGSRRHAEALLPRLVRQRLLLDRLGLLVEVLRKPFPRGLGRSAVHRRLRAARQSQTRRQSFAGQGWRAGQVWATDAGAAPRGKNARGQRSHCGARALWTVLALFASSVAVRPPTSAVSRTPMMHTSANHAPRATNPPLARGAAPIAQ